MDGEGLFDLQVNGFAGVDYNDATLDAAAFEASLRAQAACGVAALLPTIISADEATMRSRIEAVDRAAAATALGRAMVAGYHLEGPFLSALDGYRGCHPAAAMRDPDIAFVERLGRGTSKPIRLVTIAPERAGAVAFVAAARARGIEVALGHGAIDAANADAAAKAGARLSTHLGNACAHLAHKFANPIFAQLGIDALTATFIADGLHVPPAVLRAMIRAKGPGRAILVTDAVSAAGAPAGAYRFAGMAIERGADGTVRLPGTSTLAGSALALDEAMRNVVAWGAANAADAFAMASALPRALAPPRLPASRVRFDDGLRPVFVEIDGRTIVGQPEK